MKLLDFIDYFVAGNEWHIINLDDPKDYFDIDYQDRKVEDYYIVSAEPIDRHTMLVCVTSKQEV